MNRLQGVVFDMDGLLLDSERLYLDAFRDTRTSLGLAPDDDLFLQMVGTNSRFGRLKLADGLAELVPLEIFEARWAEACEERTAEGIAVKPGVTELLQELTTRDVPYAIATSTRTDRAWHHLEDAGLHVHFETLIGGDQVTNSKPAPDIYLAATAALDLPPARCAAFEDSENGVRAAHAAGLITVQVPDLIAPPDALLTLGHTVAADLLSGAKQIGLI